MQLSPVTEEDVRMFLMDYPELNTLTQAVRFSPEAISRQVEMVVDFFNSINPPTNIYYTVESFPFRYPLLLGASGYLLKSLAINESLNQYNVQGEGIVVSTRDKGQVCQELGQSLWAEFKEMAVGIKLNQNISQVFGRVNSEYLYRAR